MLGDQFIGFQEDQMLDTIYLIISLLFCIYYILFGLRKYIK
ncbi:putative membrane protein [Rickettsia rhipicephali str. Ect]|uniref:Putative membrane protein n=1 Tax=Rickettsia rhipicephali str. Ect TaxID=1359199 RepID=A0A0F3PGG3_RICRH|nr:putative membrane protein [Rickettsia rhipicephali str. Ect]